MEYGWHLSVGQCSPGPRFNIKMSSFQYRKPHCGDKTVVRSSYLHNGISYTGKMASLYWFSPLAAIIWTNKLASCHGSFCACNATSQWEMTLQCNVISHWLGILVKWSLISQGWFKWYDASLSTANQALSHYWNEWLLFMMSCDVTRPHCVMYCCFCILSG